jgi:hypothetical protein
MDTGRNRKWVSGLIFGFARRNNASLSISIECIPFACELQQILQGQFASPSVTPNGQRRAHPSLEPTTKKNTTMTTTAMTVQLTVRGNACQSTRKVAHALIDTQGTKCAIEDKRAVPQQLCMFSAPDQSCDETTLASYSKKSAEEQNQSILFKKVRDCDETTPVSCLKKNAEECNSSVLFKKSMAVMKQL